MLCKACFYNLRYFSYLLVSVSHNLVSRNTQVDLDLGATGEITTRNKYRYQFGISTN